MIFDTSKESKHVLSSSDAFGLDFKFRGVVFDRELAMDVAVRALTGTVKWKLQMLLRAKRSVSTTDLIVQYKQQILSFIEYRTGGREMGWLDGVGWMAVGRVVEVRGDQYVFMDILSILWPHV